MCIRRAPGAPEDRWEGERGGKGRGEREEGEGREGEGEGREGEGEGREGGKRWE